MEQTKEELHIFQADDYNEQHLLRVNLLKNYPVDIDKLLLNANNDTPTGKIISIRKAIDFVSNEENGAAGLAAPQIGDWGAWFVMKMAPRNGYAVIMNPEILARSGNKQMEEGCFSESKRAVVKRAREIIVNYDRLYQNADGTWYVERVEKQKIEGWNARVFQHEYDHLRGVLICEKKDSKVIHD